MASDPLVSVLVPAYNEARTIEGVLRRVAALPLRLEIVVVDDGSVDGTGDIVEGLRSELPALRVTDAFGATATATAQITVTTS